MHACMDAYQHHAHLHTDTDCDATMMCAVWCKPFVSMISFHKCFFSTIQEFEKFARFTDSLLTRASKLSELSQQLESAFDEAGKSRDSPDGQRLTRF